MSLLVVVLLQGLDAGLVVVLESAEDRVVVVAVVGHWREIRVHVMLLQVRHSVLLVEHPTEAEIGVFIRLQGSLLGRRTILRGGSSLLRDLILRDVVTHRCGEQAGRVLALLSHVDSPVEGSVLFLRAPSESHLVAQAARLSRHQIIQSLNSLLLDRV